MKGLTAAQIKIAHLIQKDIPVTKFPFLDVTKRCGITEKEILTTIAELQKSGMIRRFGAVLRHQKAGYNENALVVWSVPEHLIEEKGRMLASLSFISHCYERRPAFMGRYNIFTMIHSGGKPIDILIEEIISVTRIKDHLTMKSKKEYKKTSPEYFDEKP